MIAQVPVTKTRSTVPEYTRSLPGLFFVPKPVVF
jgi:hypothetical protein